MPNLSGAPSPWPLLRPPKPSSDSCPSARRRRFSSEPAASLHRKSSCRRAAIGIDRVLWTEAEIAARIAEVASKLATDLCRLPELAIVVGITTGAFLFLTDLASLPRPQSWTLVFVLRSQSIGSSERSWSRKVTGVTSQHPFNLRTEVKEDNFVQRMRKMLLEEERLRNPLTQGLPWTTDEPEALILQTIGDKGIAIIGGETIRGFTNLDQAWIGMIADKLDVTLSKS